MASLNVKSRSTDKDRSPATVVGLLQRYKRKTAVAGPVDHWGRLTGVYANAIEFQRMPFLGGGGFWMTYGFVAGVLGTLFLQGLVVPGFLELRAYASIVFWQTVPWLLFMLFAYLELFSPADSPIYFDRKNRKVYKVVSVGPRRWGRIGPRNAILKAYNWSLVDAEHHATVQVSAATAQRNHHLVLLVRKSSSDPTIVDHFEFTNVEIVSALWEYIRRYMEENQAPLTAGEFPPQSTMGVYKPWSDFGGVVPFLDQPIRRWREKPWKTLFQCLAIPVTVPLYVLWLFFNRLTVWTAQQVEWPRQIVDAIGPLVTEQDLRTDTHRRLRPGPPPVI
ncbi:hypothetical protein QTI51_31090 [Variovorax sp. J22G73]|uniref:DUF6708 domain-containing protein n=1 Tax=unclassified Variovorax TaxID=663243 RepID=UPI0025761317|nr:MULTISPECIES: DUF6708 domain-containing protein [unclassified Variovorax]MDM0009303.1 hypothetical protein [Variovorax sp. J22R203]MDM0101761.1 hypothetical protein [Variovorax sp. J22G73]